MKRSDYVKREAATFRERHGGDVIATGVIAEDYARAAERAGVVWDPEEPALPERLGVRAQSLVFYCGDDTPWCAATFVGQGGAPVAPALVAAEAVRRYNAWPALRALAEEWRRQPPGKLMSMSVAAQLLERALDGKGEP